MRKITLLILYSLFVLIISVDAQNIHSYQEDTAIVMQLIKEADRYRFTKPDSSLPIANKALQLAQTIKFRKGEGRAHLSLGEYHRISGNFPESLEHLFTALRISSELEEQGMEGRSLTFIGISYIGLEEYRTALDYLLKANEINRNNEDINIISFGLTNTGVAYQLIGKLDSALMYQQMAWEVGKNMRIKAGIAFMLRETGNIYALQHKYDSAFYYYRFALTSSNDVLNSGRIYGRMAMLFDEMQKADSVLHYARLALSHSQHSLQKLSMLEASKLLTKYFINNSKPDSVIKYQGLSMALQDSLFGQEQFRKLQLLALDEQNRKHDAEQRQQQAEQEETDFRNRSRIFILLGILAIVLLLGFILFRDNRRKQIANRLLEKQKYETEKTLIELRATQAQLIQSEKMASLGELTAGIAHEIQNPLNFVNNFSEVSNELMDEMTDELNKGEVDAAKNIASDIKQNLEKITHHGKRADAIVKGMLQHSRASSGIKEPTDINALADEYFRLAYHGLRAKDKSFNATMKTAFDESLEKVNVIPQDMGRVILNLITNAFYAVTERKHTLDTSTVPIQMAGEEYKPTVTVTTKLMTSSAGESRVQISVKDNGNGIPHHVLEKIFQPFFTTKPTGRGTGLGLSLSYDIVAAHGGELKVESKEGEYAEFMIILPTIKEKN